MASDAIRGRTPDQGATMAALARDALVAAIDDGAPVRAGGGLRVDSEAGPDGLVLVLQLAGRSAVLALDPIPRPTGPRWRDTWVLAIVDGDGAELGVLAAGDALAIADTRRPLRAHLRSRRRAIVRDLDGSREVVPIAEVGFGCATAHGGAPTAPWWELDLGATSYLARIRVDIARPPADTRVVLRAYGHRTPSGAPPADSRLGEALAEELDGKGSRAILELDGGVVARYLRVELAAAAPIGLAVLDSEVLAAALHADSLEATLRRAFTLFRDQPLVVATHGDEVVFSYGELWTRAMALGRGLATRVGERATVALVLANRAEWLMADLAALARAWPSVPIAVDASDHDLAAMLAQSGATCVITDAAGAARIARLGLAPPPLIVSCEPAPGALDLAQLIDDGAGLPPVPPAPRAPDDLATVMFTSGSTGTPRGARYSHAVFHGRLIRHDPGHAPRHLSFHPLCHVNERIHLPVVLVHGGVVAFSRGGAHVFDELVAFEPTMVGAVPRVFEVLHGRYQRRLRALIAAEPAAARGALEARALAEVGAALGSRVQVVSTGAAPVSAELRAFLDRCFPDCWISEGYGTTEIGMIMSEGVVYDHVEVRLVALPGDERPGEPERGEIHVRTPDAVSGYLDAPLAAVDGFIATGDLGERGADGRVRVVGRLRSAVKLAQGEFVAADRVEAALATAAIVDRIYVHAAPGAAALAALVVPDAAELGRRLGVAAPLAALIEHPDAAAAVVAVLRSHGQSAGLARHELPRAVLLAAAGDDLVTASGKPARAALAARHGERLAALAADAPDPMPDATGDDDLVSRVVHIVSRVAGYPVAADQPLAAGVGIDSLAVAEILAALGDELGRQVALPVWFAARTPADLAARLGHLAPGRGDSTALRADAARHPHLPAVTRAPRRPAVVAVTGATGFLGAHLIEALRDRGAHVIALVRADDDAAAAARVAAAADRWRIHGAAAVDAIACDLAAPDLGLAAAARRRLVDRADTIVHAAAVVSWLLPYPALRAPNADATRALLELAAAGAMAFHHVSTLGAAPAGGDEDSRASAEQVTAAGPYSMSKWLAEEHVRAAAAAGLATAIHRPALIAGHRVRGVGNPDDILHRYLVGCADLGRHLASDAVLAMAPVDAVAAAIAAIVLAGPPAGATYHLGNADRSPSWARLGRAVAAAGIPVAPAPHREFLAALTAHPTSRLRPLAAFLADERALDQDAHRGARTEAALAGLGCALPFVDDAQIARSIAELRRRGLIA